MTIVLRNPMYRLIGVAVSLIIVAVVYFAVIKPNNDTANTAIKQSEQQVQQAVNQADKQSGGAVPQGVKDLTSCMAAAGSDTGKIQACAAKYH
jgi:flagellar biosynthesis/type III secretory pathway M-ring protein FliF/YscJ